MNINSAYIICNILIVFHLLPSHFIAWIKLGIILVIQILTWWILWYLLHFNQIKTRANFGSSYTLDIWFLTALPTTLTSTGILKNKNWQPYKHQGWAWSVVISFIFLRCKFCLTTNDCSPCDSEPIYCCKVRLKEIFEQKTLRKGDALTMHWRHFQLTYSRYRPNNK